MINVLAGLSTSRKWWGFLILLCLLLEAVALYYQYQLDYLPCVLCIHVRMLLAAILIIALIGWVTAGSAWISVLWMTVTLGLWLWMTERSYQLLGVERGWIFGECEMSSGLPSWLALEKWFPWLFEIFEPCGYTPYLLFNISMAEALIVLSTLMSLVCIASLISRAFAR